MSFRHRRERVWLLSPAAVTALFFLAQVYLWFQPNRPSSVAGASAADGPSSSSVQVRRVVQIQPLKTRSEPAEIPENEAEFWMLLRRDGQVMFFTDEVEVLTTPAQRFAVDEVDVITVEADRDAHREGQNRHARRAEP